MNENIVGYVLSFAILVPAAYFISDRVQAQEKDCLAVYDAAEKIMTQRQDGSSLRDMLVAYQGDTGRTYLTKQAFSLSMMNLPENKARYIKEFAEDQYAACERL